MWPLNDILAAWRSPDKRRALVDAWKVLNPSGFGRRVAMADLSWAIRCGRAGDERAKNRVLAAYELMIINEVTR